MKPWFQMFQMFRNADKSRIPARRISALYFRINSRLIKIITYVAAEPWYLHSAWHELSCLLDIMSYMFYQRCRSGEYRNVGSCLSCLLADQYSSEPVKVPVCQSGQCRFFCTGSRVHAAEKVCEIRIFWEKIPNSARSNLQNSGLCTAPFFRL